MHPPECVCLTCEDRRHAAGLWLRLVDAWKKNRAAGTALTGFFYDVGALVDEWQGFAGGREGQLKDDLAFAKEQVQQAQLGSGRRT
jgi:hypothetical protein